MTSNFVERGTTAVVRKKMQIMVKMRYASHSSSYHSRLTGLPGGGDGSAETIANRRGVSQFFTRFSKHFQFLTYFKPSLCEDKRQKEQVAWAMTSGDEERQCVWIHFPFTVNTGCKAAGECSTGESLHSADSYLCFLAYN